MRMLFAVGLFVPLGCMDWKHDHEKDSFGLQDDDPDAPPTPNEIRARVINDAVNWRKLRDHLGEGKADCPAVLGTPEGAKCSADQEPFEVVHFPGDAPDRPNRIEETAYYCPKEGVYYYHYMGGRDRLDVWLGPCKVSWNRK